MKNNMKRPLTAQAGFSLIEVMIAMVILSVGMLSIAAMQTSAVQGNVRSNNTTERITSASNQVERLLNLPFDHPELTPGNHTPEADGIDNNGDGEIDDAVDDGSFAYSISWLVTLDTADRKTIALTLAGGPIAGVNNIVITTVKVR